MKVKWKNQEEHCLESVRKGGITPATSTSQEEKVPLQANFIDENLDINMEKPNEEMELFMNQWKWYLETTYTAC